MGDRNNPVYVLNPALTSYDKMIEAKPTASVGLVVSNNVEGRAFLAQMRSGGTKFVRLEATGPEIEPGFNYRLRIDCALNVVEAPARGDVDGASTLDWTFRPVHSAAWGRAMEVEMQTDLTAL
jgi:hypothetical protein